MTDDLDRGSLRGAGRDASGPLLSTWQMMEWIRDQGRPVSRDEVLDECARFVDVGYARRWYARRLNYQRAKTQGEGDKSGIPLRRGVKATPASVNHKRAIRAVLVALLQERKRVGCLHHDKSRDMYTFVRMPSRTPGGLPLEQVTYHPTVQRRHVYAMEMVRKLREANARGVFIQGKGTKSLNKAERDAVMRWLGTYEDHAVDEVPGVTPGAVAILRGMRERADGVSPKTTSAEKVALEMLWLALDHSAPRA